MTQANTANRKAIREAEKKARQIELEDSETLVGLMTTKSGRAFIWRKLEDAGVFHTTYHDNPQRMAFLEGGRATGLALLSQVMQWCPDYFIQAMREANERRIHDQHDINTAAGDATGQQPGSEEPGRESEDEPTGPTLDPATGEVRYDA